MLRWFVHKLGRVILVLIGATLITFLLMHAIPRQSMEQLFDQPAHAARILR